MLLTMADLDASPWASCGPASLAALLQRPLPELRHAFPRATPSCTWTNLERMRYALNSLGAIGLSFEETLLVGAVEGVRDALARAWPRRGLAIVQFRGSWDAMPVNHPAQLQRSHWVACVPVGTRFGDQELTTDAIFDINAVESGLGGWLAREEWLSGMVAYLVEGFGKKATGEWWLRAALEVRG